MSRFYINVNDLLKDYGTKVRVWSADDLKPRYEAGEEIKPELSDIKPDERNEPVLPFSSSTSQLATLISGGTETQADLLWLSSGDYPINSVVEVPSQGSKYRVMSRSNYTDYSNLIVYQLKGDDLHRNGY